MRGGFIFWTSFEIELQHPFQDWQKITVHPPAYFKRFIPLHSVGLSRYQATPSACRYQWLGWRVPWRLCPIQYSNVPLEKAQWTGVYVPLPSWNMKAGNDSLHTNSSHVPFKLSRRRQCRTHVKIHPDQWGIGVSDFPPFLKVDLHSTVINLKNYFWPADLQCTARHFEPLSNIFPSLWLAKVILVFLIRHFMSLCIWNKFKAGNGMTMKIVSHRWRGMHFRPSRKL